MEKRVRLEQINAAANVYKAYEISLTEKSDGWSVSGWNGRIGSPLKEQPKANGLSLKDAEEVFEKLLKNQVKKGYKPAGAGASLVSLDGITDPDPEMIPALPTAIGDEPVVLKTDDWLVQEKFDGENRPIRVKDGAVFFANRKGQPVPGNENLRNALLGIAQAHGDFHVNSEDMGESGVVIFDVVEGFGVSRSDGFSVRNEALKKLEKIVRDESLIGVSVAVPFAEFEAGAQAEKLMARGAEGYVLKKASSGYSQGRSNNPKKAAMLKIKFVEDATFRISKGREAHKRSVGIESWDDETQSWVSKGNVTIPVNAAMPEEGTFADVRYLYAYEGGSVFQPVWKGPRADVTPADCSVSKLKIKASPAVGDVSMEM